MLKLISLYTLCFMGLGWGYSLDQISLSDYEYRRYVRPQLKSISTDYQTLLFLLNPSLQVFKESYRTIRDIYSYKEKIEKECHENFINDECYKIILDINKQSKKLILSDYSVEKVKIDNVDEQFFHYNLFQSFQNLALSYKLLTDKLIFQKEYIDFNIFDYRELINKTTELYSVFNLFILKSSFKPTRSEFTAYWIGFIKPVFEHILIQNNLDYFKNNITNFNVTWNILNVKLTKRNIPISKQIKTLLNIMHNRWNNILKVSLNTRS
jgi:hypothetical protein